MRMHRDVLAGIVAAALLALPATALGAGDKPGDEWSPLTDSAGAVNITNTNEIGLTRTGDGVLHVLWVNNRGATEALLHTAVTGTAPESPGTVGDPSLVLSVNPAANQSFNTSVDLVGTGTGLQALFSTTFPGSPFDSILATSTSATGATWSAPVPASATATGQRSPVYVAAGIGGGVDAQGLVTGAWGDSSPDGGGYRVGLSTNGGDGHFPATLGDIDPDVATDSVSGATFIAVNHLDVGINLITQAGADAGTVPQSAAAWTQQRTSITGRIGAPGVWVGYGTGDNMFNAKPAIYQVGSSKFIFLKNQSDAAHVGIAAAPGGKLWIYWDRSGKVYASRTNSDVSKFGAIVKVPEAQGADTVYRLAGDGALGGLDLLALTDVGGTLDWYVERLAPGLKLETVGSPQVKRGEKITFLVTDAGDPVKGIDVTTEVDGKQITKSTNGSGEAKLKIPKSAGKGNHKASTDAAPDYTDGLVAYKIKG